MKSIFISFLLLGSCGLLAQDFTFQHFEQQVIDYRPLKLESVSQKDFDYACMILGQTRKATKENPDNFNLADYFNVLSAFLTLKQDKDAMYLAFEKFRLSEGSCEYAIDLESTINTNEKYRDLRKAFDQLREECESRGTLKEAFDIESYCKEHGLDLKLVKLIQEIDKDDQRYRGASSNTEKQTALDQMNQKKIDMLRFSYDGYVGRSLVGPRFESVMWSVVQHSNTNFMDHYIDDIHKAVQNGELAQAPFEMLLDRLYGLKHGYQFFGTQQGFGFELATDEQREAIIDKYDLK